MFAVIDVSLAATAVATVDGGSGSVVDTVSVDNHMVDGEVSPLEWLRAIDEAWSRLGAPAVEAIGVAAFASGLVVLDGKGHPVRSVWDDDRSEPDAGWCRKKMPAEWWESEVGIVPEARQAVTKMSWMHRSEADAWSTIASFVLPGDFVASRLAGHKGFVTTIANSLSYGVFRVSDASAHPQVTELIDRERDWSNALPTVVPETRSIGRWNGAEVFPAVVRTRFDDTPSKSSVISGIAAHFASFRR
ncbi:MAG: hypothetical protein B7C54_05205 [Acidimicrobiales bacterium mtb01]|nr:hypothetical protein [Actinomycetota bacterium]TEX46607.1 MAG: hypothetical protein B7C54_05205 [Acidimicrobiales bacterium mtb01]